MLGTTLRETGDAARSIRLLENARALKEYDAPTQSNLALSYAALGQWEKGLEAARRSANLQSESAQAWCLLADVAARAKNVDEARKARATARTLRGSRC